MKNISCILSAIFALSLTFPGFASETKAATFHISCRELLDLATYAEYFSKNINIREHEKTEFATTSHMGGEASSTLSFKLIYLDEEAFMEIAWSNYLHGRLVESRKDQISVERGRPYELELQARHYSSSFRNSCIINLK